MKTINRLVKKIDRLVRKYWTKGWARLSGAGPFGRLAAHLATCFVRPYRGLYHLATLNPKGFFAPSARIAHDQMQIGKHVFIGDRVVLYRGRGGGPLEIGDDVHVNQDCILETAQGGSIAIGSGSRIQPRCQFSAYVSRIEIGRGVQIAPNCAFYPYDHEFESSKPIIQQGLKSRGGIVIEDDAWLGYNVIVLDGVRIGSGAIIGAGSVVKANIPSGAIAVGMPARVVKHRDGSSSGLTSDSKPIIESGNDRPQKPTPPSGK